MELNIAQALKQPGQIFEAEREQAFAPQLYNKSEVTFAAPVRINFTFSYDGEALVLDGYLNAQLCARCARCNEAFIETLQFPFTERFVKGAAENDDSYAFDGEVLTLTTMTLDNLFLNLPIQSVCREDCEGLCPICGCNLNTVRCACKVGEPDDGNPLTALEQLLNEDKEV